MSCHDRFAARGKSNEQIFTSADCSRCHIDVTQNAIRFDHSAVTKSCSSCHNGIGATGTPDGHFGSNSECDACHIYTDATLRTIKERRGGEHRVGDGDF